MPVGCFPSFRKKIKKFNKGKAPLHKKEETNNNVASSGAKSAEENNNEVAKSEASIKVDEEQPKESAPSQPEVEESQQNHQEASPEQQNFSEDNFEQVISHDNQTNEAEVQEIAMKEESQMKEEAVPPSEAVFESANYQEAAPCEAPPMEAEGHVEVEESTKVEEVHQEEVPASSTDVVGEFMNNQESASWHESESPCQAAALLDKVIQEAVNECPPSEGVHHEEEQVHEPEMVCESLDIQESAPCNEMEVPCETVAPTEVEEHVEVQESTKAEEVHQEETSAPSTDIMCEFTSNQETAPWYEGESLCRVAAINVNSEFEAFSKDEKVHQEEEPAPPEEILHESSDNQESTPHLDNEAAVPEDEIVEKCSLQVEELVPPPEGPCECMDQQDFTPSQDDTELKVVEEPPKHEEIHQEENLSFEVAPPVVATDQQAPTHEEVEPPCEPNLAKSEESPAPLGTESPCEAPPPQDQESFLQETKVPSTEVQSQSESQDQVLPKGFQWKILSYPLPEGAIDIRELHFPIHVGLVETCKGEIPCKFLERNHSFYAGIDGREEAFAYGKILCLEPSMFESIELEWVHVSNPEIRSKNLVAGARDALGKPMYIARGMVPLTGPYPRYELSCGWAPENLDHANLAFCGVEWQQHDFDVLAWKPRYH